MHIPLCKPSEIPLLKWFLLTVRQHNKKEQTNFKEICLF